MDVAFKYRICISLVSLLAIVATGWLYTFIPNRNSTQIAYSTEMSLHMPTEVCITSCTAYCKKKVHTLIQIPVLSNILRNNTPVECTGNSSIFIGWGYSLKSILVLRNERHAEVELRHLLLFSDMQCSPNHIYVLSIWVTMQHWLPSIIMTLTESRVFLLGDSGLYASSAYTMSVLSSLWQTNTSSMPFPPILWSADTPTATHPSACPSNSNSRVSLEPLSIHWA